MKKYLLLIFLLPLIAKSQNVGISTSTPQEKLHLNGSLLITPAQTDDTIKNSTVAIGSNSYILTYNAAKGALHFGIPNANTNWYNNNTGVASLAFGLGAQASGTASFSTGLNSIASGPIAAAFGNGNIASGFASMAGGALNIASGQESFAFGDNLIIRRTAAAGFGTYNDTSQSASTLFSVGNGTALNVRKTAFTVLDNGRVGIGGASPGYMLDVFDQANQGFFVNFTSNNPSNSFVQIQSNAPIPNVANIGFGLDRNGAPKGYFYLDGSNNLIMSASPTVATSITLNSSGNVGINQGSPGFPLNFASSTGDKISLYGNSGATYGFGISTNLLQIHTDVVGSDIGFGFGSSVAFTEKVRIKGNGNMGIGVINPVAKLHILQDGNYAGAEGSGHALELRDNSTATEHILYMGSDAGNSLSYIQSVASGGFRDLLLQGRGGNVTVGKDGASVLSVKGDLIVDYAGANNANTSFALRFGTSSSGEAIASKRTAGGNINGLDFYTAGVNRMNISNAGQVTIPGSLSLGGFQGMTSDISGQRQKMITGDAGLASPGGGYASGYDATGTYLIPNGVFTGKPVAWIASYTSTSGECNKFLVTTEVVANGSTWQVNLPVINVSGANASFNGVWKIVMMGPY